MGLKTRVPVNQAFSLRSTTPANGQGGNALLRGCLIPTTPVSDCVLLLHLLRLLFVSVSVFVFVLICFVCLFFFRLDAGCAWAGRVHRPNFFLLFGVLSACFYEVCCSSGFCVILFRRFVCLFVVCCSRLGAGCAWAG